MKDLENNKRYKELLDEEAMSYGFDNYASIKYSGHEIEVKAFHRYFTELLEESNKLAESRLRDIKELEKELADYKDRLESEKQITEQAAKDLTEAKETIEKLRDQIDAMNSGDYL